jgi:membrane protease YdiL (CAAX protease family)
MEQLVTTPWGDLRRKPLWFIAVSLLVFPAAILMAASLQPASFRDKDSGWRLYSINVLFLHLVTFLIVSVGFLRCYGRVRFKELGWSVRRIPGAIAATACCWLVAQVISLGVAASGMISRPTELTTSGITTQICRFIANSVGTGSNEETFFRGFLLVQVYCWTPGTISGSKLNLRSLAWATIVSSCCFAILHFRTNITDILHLTVGGMMGACLYARTRNLLVNVGLHGLFNAPMCLASCDETTSKMSVLAGMILVAAFWPLAGRPAVCDQSGETARQ